jgi:hypothetical protein
MSKAGIVDGIYNASQQNDSIMMMNSTARNNSTGSQPDSKFRS